MKLGIFELQKPNNSSIDFINVKLETYTFMKNNSSIDFIQIIYYVY